jgi:hypothetical protein
VEKEAAQDWLGAAMARPTNCEDRHPALNERLAAIGEEASLNPPEPGQASDTLLGLSLDATIKALDARWKNIIPNDGTGCDQGPSGPGSDQSNCLDA